MMFWLNVIFDVVMLNEVWFLWSLDNKLSYFICEENEVCFFGQLESALKGLLQWFIHSILKMDDIMSAH